MSDWDSLEWTLGWDDGMEGQPRASVTEDYLDGYYHGEQEREELDKTGSSNT